MVRDGDVADPLGHAAKEGLDIGVVVAIPDNLVANGASNEPEVAGLDILGTPKELLRRNAVEPAR